MAELDDRVTTKTSAVQANLDDSLAHYGAHRLPAGLGHRVGQILYRRKKTGEAELVLDWSRYLPAGAFEPFNTYLKTYYVDPDAGNDGNAGTTFLLQSRQLSARAVAIILSTHRLIPLSCSTLLSSAGNVATRSLRRQDQPHDLLHGVDFGLRAGPGSSRAPSRILTP